ncbi:toll/interleukin-1 receptor domain-containing protein [Nitrosomonas communis]|uniref:toll/interleukin-1 receptor domain-containing protein n=1 Tax=Nitrosomonas communis TaxID=44574 RepID=UPI0026EB9B12|nr:toll/interleukin-1 receptor domain-containing protein [Nitrosomonas communis]MCO6428973.1 TIR domain-containing protein [Nitrosomonas communis]
MKERHWNNLVTSLRYGQCVLVLGPEIPADIPRERGAGQLDSQITYTDALRDQLAAELEEDGRRITATSLAGVAQQYEDADGFGPGMLRSQSAGFYTSSQLEPSTIHREIASLPFSLVLSTCHDQLLEMAFRSVGKSSIVYRYNLRGDGQENPEFAVPVTLNSPLIYHLFGYFEEPQSLVLSENDLLDFLLAVISGTPPLPNSLRRALQRNGASFLFVGFGIRHWYLRVLLKALVRGLALGRTGSSVAVEPLLQGVPDQEREQTILFYQRGTRIEICEEDIHSFLSELDRRLKATGGIATQPVTLGSRPRVFVSYASEDQGLAARLFASLQKEGFEPWLDKDALRGGEDWNLMIEDQLRETDYMLVLQTPALAAKKVGYVNKEIAIAREQALRYRGSFLIPLVVGDLSVDDKIKELGSYQQLPLRENYYDQDLADLVSTLTRDYQRRQRK